MVGMPSYKYKNQVSTQLLATTDENIKEFNPKLVKLATIFNYGENDLLVSINKPFNGDNSYLIIPSGIPLTWGDNEEVECNKLYFKTEEGETNFQVVGFESW